jgi:ankyrin repeat protein
VNVFKVSIIISITLFILHGCLKADDESKKYFKDPLVQQLAEAGELGDLSKIQSLINSGVNVNQVGKQGMTPLFWVLQHNNLAGFKKLLESSANPNYINDAGISVIIHASSLKNSHFLELALNYGADPNIVHPSKSTPTPLFAAIFSLNMANIKLLINKGANLNFVDHHNASPMKLAADLNRWDYVYYFLERGADYKLTDRWSNSIIYNLENNRINKSNKLYDWREKVINFLKNKGEIVKAYTPKG